MTLPSEGKSHQLHCDLPTDVFLMTRQETRSFLTVKNWCAVDIIAIIWSYSIGSQTNKLVLRHKEKGNKKEKRKKGKRVEIPVTLHLSEVTNASQQAEGYPDQSHYSFHIPSQSYQEQHQSLLKTPLKADQIKTNASIKRPVFLHSPWYSQVQ